MTGGGSLGGSRYRLPYVRICIVYDCLYPYTVGGAERFYRNLAERLAADGSIRSKVLPTTALRPENVPIVTEVHLENVQN